MEQETQIFDGTLTKPMMVDALNNTFFPQRANIYQYDYDPNAIDPNKENVFKKSFFMKPWLIVILVNIFALLGLLAIGFGVSVGVSGLYSKQYGEYCNKTSDCVSGNNLTCHYNRCTCLPLTHFNSGGKCLPIQTNGSECSSNAECGYGTYCVYSATSNKGYCDCMYDRYWNSTSKYCQKKLSYGASGCSSASQCANGTNLICSGGNCTCESYQVWNGTYCINIVSYEGSCSFDAACNTTQLLQCAITNQTLYVCVCDNYYYWSTTSLICTSMGTYTDSCTSSSQCRYDYGLYCDTTTTNTCICNSTFYWTGTECDAKVSNGQSCTVATCDDTKGLICSSGTCQCPTNYFFNGTSCQYILGDGSYCKNAPYDSACDTSKYLVCDSVTKFCICPNLYYWNYTICVNQLYNGTACVKDIQCRTDLGLSCNSVLGYCACANGYYWKVASKLCTKKSTFTETCDFTYECEDYNLLICSGTGGTCKCPTDMFWDTSLKLCVNQYLFSVGCSLSYPATNLQCLTSKLLQCDTTSLTCRCTDHTTNYYKSPTAGCVAKLAYGATCNYQVYTNTNYQCDESKNLVCLLSTWSSSTWTCNCPNNRYWDTATTTCVLKGTKGDTCTSTTQCQDYLGLICWLNNSTCLCAATTEYWDSSAHLCTTKLGYGSNCTADSDCKDYAFMYCHATYKNCSCPSDRFYSPTYTACLPRSSHDQTCTIGTGSGECITPPTRPLSCISFGSYGLCQCENYLTVGNTYYWSTAASDCKACPTNYKSSYGVGISNSAIPITTRCYYYTTGTTKSASAAEADCVTKTAHLMSVRTTMEMGIAAYFTGSTVSLWLDSTSTTSQSFSWANGSPSTILSILYCRSNPDLTDCNTNTCALSVQGINAYGVCIDDVHASSTLGYICEYAMTQ